jgi:hypothetical protein
VLSGAGLGDDSLLAHPLREQNLPQCVVDLVRAGVTEILALEVDPGAAEFFRQALGEIKRRLPAGVFPELALKLAAKRGIAPRGAVSLLQLDQRRHERLGHVSPAEDAEVAAPVRRSSRRE